ncbi:MAG: type III toxin-antitoxin system ToxN/AbiQ family toxin [Bacilli bacterium]|nr:type III toxin-antitoxin system ToxN/AbiQ family toxin [Bacilli bacterium]MDD4795088.1 type III toxin-antitoxin system ToxN/AbiQ family toxin [Bacilli bacterium]
MYKNFKIVKINSDYCDYLRTFDNKVPYNAGKKELRPFIGVLFIVEKHEYFAPLASPKPKHKILKNTLDLLKIENGIYGVINFNNMLPVASGNYQEFNLNKKTNIKEEMFRIELLTNQLRWLTANRTDVLTKSKILYKLYKNKKLPKNVEARCCNFMLLEKKCKEYNKIDLL